MPFRRRNARRPARRLRRKVYRRKPAFKRNRIARIYHKFKRIVDLGEITAYTSATTPYPYSKAFSFQLSDLPNLSEYQALYDQFKITGVQIQLIPKVMMTTQGSSTGTPNMVGYGQLVTALDFDDASFPTSKESLLQYENAKVSQCGRIHKRFLKPRIMDTIFRNSGTTGVMSTRPGWLDLETATAEVPHYGCKVWIDAPANSAGTTSSSISYNVLATYWFMCKNTR